ncbi:Uncharacterized protein conserved in bacteria [Pluralibacter gergoviae]|nr:Uncharacterized protein conserved in bacteria [Pluralibacter gergoviae]
MQVSNPFDDAQGQFYILQNARSAFSLWPQQCPLPAGWHPVCQPQPLEDCNTLAGAALDDPDAGELCGSLP